MEPQTRLLFSQPKASHTRASHSLSVSTMAENIAGSSLCPMLFFPEPAWGIGILWVER
jgi:hypothetical protein